jgi:hypothetical protein
LPIFAAANVEGMVRLWNDWSLPFYKLLPMLLDATPAQKTWFSLLHRRVLENSKAVGEYLRNYPGSCFWKSPCEELRSSEPQTMTRGQSRRPVTSLALPF